MSDVRIRVRRPNPPEMVEDKVTSNPIGVPKDSRLIMGIDASLTNTGVALLINGRLMTTSLEPKKMRGVERLAWFRDKFAVMLRLYDPVLVVTEGYAFGAKQSREAMGELGGIVRLAVHDADLPLKIVQPTCLKLFATGKGNGAKDEVSKELFKRFGVDLSDNNQVDAAGLAIMGLATIAEDMSLTEFQRRALSKLAE